MIATIVTNNDELSQIHHLNRQNLKYNINNDEKNREGFVSWLYSEELLFQMHQLAPSVIVKDGSTIAGYALTTLKESRKFHTDLETMFHHLESVNYNGKSLVNQNFYCMGQICVAMKFYFWFFVIAVSSGVYFQHFPIRVQRSSSTKRCQIEYCLLER